MTAAARGLTSGQLGPKLSADNKGFQRIVEVVQLVDNPVRDGGKAEGRNQESHHQRGNAYPYAVVHDQREDAEYSKQRGGQREQPAGKREQKAQHRNEQCQREDERERKDFTY